jgi:hypothetical protein
MVDVEGDDVEEPLMGDGTEREMRLGKRGLGGGGRGAGERGPAHRGERGRRDRGAEGAATTLLRQPRPRWLSARVPSQSPPTTITCNFLWQSRNEYRF